ncbi:MAG: peptide-methionine (S)-S-oxide reductase MsrA [Rhodospirillales bacterium]
MAKATFAAGCFWGVEETFRTTPGVTATRVGYIGGTSRSPTYEDVCTGRTGHAEAVDVEYDPDRISYEELLETFWSAHDPTQLDRQGPDIGTQYRSAIFPRDAAQKAVAEKAIAALNASGRLRRPVATRIETASTFWEAEDYHQQYVAKKRSKFFGFFG